MYCGKCGSELDGKGRCSNCDKQKNNKKIALIIVAFLLILCLIVISIIIYNNKEKNDSYLEYTSDLNENYITAYETNNINQVEYKYYEYHDYSENLAWINFSDDNNHYWGCIDKSGKLLFSFKNTNIIEISDFSNGYAYITYPDFLKIIDKRDRKSVV